MKEYKVWWDNNKYYLGDRWKDIDRLSAQMRHGYLAKTIWSMATKNSCKGRLPKGFSSLTPPHYITLQLIAGEDMKTVSVRAGYS